MQQTQGTAGNESPNFLADIGGRFGRGALTGIDLLIAKQLQDWNDGELPMTYDPFNGSQIGKFDTMGSAPLRSIWRSTDMLWLGLAGTAILAAFLLKK